MPITFSKLLEFVQECRGFVLHYSSAWSIATLLFLNAVIITIIVAIAVLGGGAAEETPSPAPRAISATTTVRKSNLKGLRRGVTAARSEPK